MCQLFGYPIGDGISTGHNGPEGGCQLYEFWGGHRIGEGLQCWDIIVCTWCC